MSVLAHYHPAEDGRAGQPGASYAGSLRAAAELLDVLAPDMPARDRLNVFVTHLEPERQRELLAGLAAAGATIAAALEDLTADVDAGVCVVSFNFDRDAVAVRREVWTLVPPARDSAAGADAGERP
jgi:hypothetical protein